MPRLLPDRLWRRGAAAFICLVALLCLPPGHAAPAPADPVQVKWKNLVALHDDDTTSLDGVVITQVQGTLIRARKAEGSRVSNKFADSHWALTGQVHIEYDGFVLDADAATVIFANSLIQSIQVQGAPAKFSRPGKIAGRSYQGTAQAIGFDGAKRQVRFTGRAWFSYGPSEGTSDKPLVYDLNTAILSSEKGGSTDAPVNMTIQGKLKVQSDSLRAVRDDGTVQLDGVVITQAPGTLIRAGRAEGSELSNGSGNSLWKLTAPVHVEHKNFVLDAEDATVAFASELVRTIDVHGSPATFSHPGKVAGRPYLGNAQAIGFDATKQQVRFTGRSWFSYASCEGTSEKPMIYNLGSGAYHNEKTDDAPPIRATCRREKRADRGPAATPRAPGSTAQ
jgi:lipopolysaccharide transport protein LptA